MITYDNLTTHLPPELHQTLRDTKIKQPSKHTDLIIEDLISSHQNFSSGRSDRKILLDDYLQQKFGDQTEKYKDVLKELGI